MPSRQKKSIILVALCLLLLFWIGCDTSEDAGAYDDSTPDDSPNNDHKAKAYFHLSADAEAIHNPFGRLNVAIKARDMSPHIRRAKWLALDVPADLHVRFEPDVVLFRPTVQTTMTVFGRMAEPGDYAFSVAVQWTDEAGRTWKTKVPFVVEVVEDYLIEDLWAWTKNPALIKDIGLWDNRTFCWTLGGGCDIQPQPNAARWVDDGEVVLFAQDDNRLDLGCDCAALTQGESVHHPGQFYGAQLDPIRTGDVSSALMIFSRSDAGTGPTPVLGAAGNIINLWIQHPNGDYFGFDFYFETDGIDDWTFIRGERLWWPDGRSCVYSVHMSHYPEYWARTKIQGDVENWVVDLRAVIDRAMELSRWDLRDFRWKRIEPISESFALFSDLPTSAWQTFHFFEIKIGFYDQGSP